MSNQVPDVEVPPESEVLTDTEQLKAHIQQLQDLVKLQQLQQQYGAMAGGYDDSESDDARGWNPQIEKMLAELEDKSWGYTWMHKKSVNFFTKLNDRLSITNIIFSLISGTSTFATLNTCSGQLFIQLGTGIVIYAAALLSALQHFKGYAEMIEKHKLAASKYSGLYHSIQKERAVKPQQRQLAKDYITWITNQYDSYLLSSPEIEDTIMEMYVRQYKSKNERSGQVIGTEPDLPDDRPESNNNGIDADRIIVDYTITDSDDEKEEEEIREKRHNKKRKRRKKKRKKEQDPICSSTETAATQSGSGSGSDSDKDDKSETITVPEHKEQDRQGQQDLDRNARLDQLLSMLEGVTNLRKSQRLPSPRNEPGSRRYPGEGDVQAGSPCSPTGVRQGPSPLGVSNGGDEEYQLTISANTPHRRSKSLGVPSEQTARRVGIPPILSEQTARRAGGPASARGNAGISQSRRTSDLASGLRSRMAMSYDNSTMEYEMERLDRMAGMRN